MRLGSARLGTARFATLGPQAVTSSTPVPLELIPFGLYPFGLKPFGWGPAPTSPPLPAPIFDPLGEWQGWLSDKLDRSVSSNRVQIRDRLPQITFTVVDMDEPTNLAGTGGLGNWTVQIDVWADSSAEARLIQAQIRQVLMGYRGPMGLSFCQGMTPARGLTSFDQGPTQSASGVYRSMRMWTLMLEY